MLKINSESRKFPFFSQFRFAEAGAGFYWTVKWVLEVAFWSVLHVVVEAKMTPLYSGLGYRAFLRLVLGRLKKKCWPCRYCVGCLGLYQF